MQVDHMVSNTKQRQNTAANIASTYWTFQQVIQRESQKKEDKQANIRVSP